MTMSREVAGPDGGPAPHSPARLTIESPLPGVRLIGVDGALDRRSSPRLLRLVDSQLALARSGLRRLEALVIDVSTVGSLDRGGPAAFGHIRYACRRAGIEVLVAGFLGGAMSSSLPARGPLNGFRTFPTADAALRSLDRRWPGEQHPDPTARPTP